MERVVEPEWLDDLAEDDPRAEGNRRDLRLLNALMGNHRWLSQRVAAQWRPGDRILEVGAGRGEWGQHVMRRVPGARVDGLDLWSRPSSYPDGCDWYQADLREFGGFADYDVIVANLILHQFEGTDLARLGRAWSGCRVVLANEPVRSGWALWQVKAAGLLGLNDVSRHDARVSVRAGFVGQELAEILGLAAPGWDIEIRCGWMSQYRLEAVHR